MSIQIKRTKINGVPVWGATVNGHSIQARSLEALTGAIITLSGEVQS